MRSAVITREYFPHIRVSILLGKVGTVHPGRVTAALRVHEKFRVWNVPLYGAQRFRYEFLERQPRVVHPDLMATKRGARATCNYYKTISSRSSRVQTTCTWLNQYLLCSLPRSNSSIPRRKRGRWRRRQQRVEKSRPGSWSLPVPRRTGSEKGRRRRRVWPWYPGRGRCRI